MAKCETKMMEPAEAQAQVIARVDEAYKIVNDLQKAVAAYYRAALLKDVDQEHVYDMMEMVKRLGDVRDHFAGK